MTYFINTTMLDTINTTSSTTMFGSTYSTKVVKLSPNKGETWWVKLPDSVTIGKSTLDKVVVTEVTAHTVEVKTVGGYLNRYVKDDVQFVEKVYNEVL